MVGGRVAIRASWSPDPDPMMQMFIDGEWVESSTSARFQSFDPYAEQAWRLRARGQRGDQMRRRHGLKRARPYEADGAGHDSGLRPGCGPLMAVPFPIGCNGIAQIEPRLRSLESHQRVPLAVNRFRPPQRLPAEPDKHQEEV
jgi:hypothetical protein